MFSNPIEEMGLLNGDMKKRKRVRNKSPVRQAVRKLLRGGMDYLAKKKKRGGALKPAGGALKRAGEGKKGGSLVAAIVPIAAAIATDVGAHLIDKLGQAVKSAITNIMDQFPQSSSSLTPKKDNLSVTERNFYNSISGGGMHRQLQVVDEKLCDMLSASSRPTVDEFLRTAASEYALALGDDRMETVLHGGCMALMQVMGNGMKEDLVADELSLAILGAWPKNKEKIENVMEKTAEKIAEAVVVAPKKKRVLSEKQREALARGREARRLKKEAMKSAL